MFGEDALFLFLLYPQQCLKVRVLASAAATKCIRRCRRKSNGLDLRQWNTGRRKTVWKRERRTSSVKTVCCKTALATGNFGAGPENVTGMCQ